jgi:hypothetical protein
MSEQGRGTAQDDGEAVKWYRLAAAQGVASAQDSLGRKYLNGEGVTQDNLRADMWFNLASVSGDADGAKNRDSVAGQMTPQQVAQAQKMARDCQQRRFKGCD